MIMCKIKEYCSITRQFTHSGINFYDNPIDKQVLAMTFKKGHDINRYVPKNEGLTEFHNKLSEYLRNRSLEAVTFLFDTMHNEKASIKVRVACAVQVLDRGLGKAVDRSVVVTLDNGTAQDPTKLTSTELRAIINKLDDKPLVIDADFEEVN